MGPAAASHRAAVSSGGAAVLGKTRTVEHISGTNEYRVDFGLDPAQCTFNATLATVQAGSVVEQPQAGRITVARDGARVLVRTYGATGAAAEQPFHLTVSR